jgi:hypothetical protein
MGVMGRKLLIMAEQSQVLTTTLYRDRRNGAIAGHKYCINSHALVQLGISDT